MVKEKNMVIHRFTLCEGAPDARSLCDMAKTKRELETEHLN